MKWPRKTGAMSRPTLEAKALEFIRIKKKKKQKNKQLPTSFGLGRPEGMPPRKAPQVAGLGVMTLSPSETRTLGRMTNSNSNVIQFTYRISTNKDLKQLTEVLFCRSSP